ncbi:MAG: hypothetical protein C5B52_13995 [Bacteroidetes bacterium]|nr:MAG: hypothetical protein C5B52_13995 [Bacteroidota bacterium]
MTSTISSSCEGEMVSVPEFALELDNLTAAVSACLPLCANKLHVPQASISNINMRFKANFLNDAKVYPK